MKINLPISTLFLAAMLVRAGGVYGATYSYSLDTAVTGQNEVYSAPLPTSKGAQATPRHGSQTPLHVCQSPEHGHCSVRYWRSYSERNIGKKNRDS